MYRDLFRINRYLKDPFNIRKTNISFTNISVSWMSRCIMNATYFRPGSSSRASPFLQVARLSTGLARRGRLIYI
jgi:hypothetical protein